MAPTPTEGTRPKRALRFRVARWLVICLVLIGARQLLREPNRPEVVLLPPTATIQHNPMPDRWIPRTWGWMWRFRDLLMGRRAPVDFDAFVVRPVEPGLAADIERLAAPAAATNGLRIWSMHGAQFDDATELARKVGRVGLRATESRINTADGITATIYNGQKVPVAGGGFADVGFQLEVLPLTRKRATDVTFRVKWTEMLDAPQPSDEGATNFGAVIRTNLLQAARVQVRIGNGIVLMQSPSETAPGLVLLLSVGRK